MLHGRICGWESEFILLTLQRNDEACQELDVVD